MKRSRLLVAPLTDNCDARGREEKIKNVGRVGPGEGEEKEIGAKTQLVGVLKLGSDGHDLETDCAIVLRLGD